MACPGTIFFVQQANREIVMYGTRQNMRILFGPVFLNTSNSKRAVTCEAYSPPKWLLIPGITIRGINPRQFYGVKKYAKRDTIFNHSAMAPRKDPKETLTFVFHSGLTDVKELLSKTGLNEKKLYRNLAKLKKGKTRSNHASLTQAARAHPEYSAKDLRNELQERRDFKLCTHTVQRSLSVSGYTKKSQTKFPIWPLYKMLDIRARNRKLSMACQQPRLDTCGLSWNGRLRRRLLSQK